MPNNARNIAPLTERQTKVAQWYLQGATQVEIGNKLEVSQPTISRDIHAIIEHWKASAVRDFDEARSQELAKIDELERTYWKAWFQSVGTSKVETIKAKSHGRAGGAEKTIKTEELNGDPRYLSGVMDCIKKRCDLLGIDAPKKLQHSGALDVRGIDFSDHE